MVWRFFYIQVFTSKRFLRKVLIIGAGKAGKTLLKAVNQISPAPFSIIGLIDDNPEIQNMTVEGVKVIATSDRMLEIIEKEKITDIIVSISGEIQGKTFQKLLDAQQKDVEIIRMPVLYEQLFSRVPIDILEADWILRSFVDQFKFNRFYALSKRVLDIVGGMVGTLVLIVLFPFVAIAILLESGRPIFYSQTRLGKGGQEFNIIKFRTMRQDAEKNGEAQLATEDDERATKVGLTLRKTHIDEIPQFINVLKGDMSMVGPRSERPSLVEHYLRRIPFYRARLLVKPGITGWAQVNFGYAGTVEETIIKLEYDLFYIKNRNLILDLLTILRTPGTMLGMQGQ
jgi:exopolysaccharide biosynthesis polyprenyl glycosylphosphotransferase